MITRNYVIYSLQYASKISSYLDRETSASQSTPFYFACKRRCQMEDTKTPRNYNAPKLRHDQNFLSRFPQATIQIRFHFTISCVDDCLDQNKTIPLTNDAISEISFLSLVYFLTWNVIKIYVNVFFI